MNRLELVDALTRSGFDFLDLVDRQRFVDEAVREFEAEELWPWRAREEVGVPPMTIARLGPIDSVRVDGTHRPLWPRRHSELVEQGVDLEGTGSPRFYYMWGGNDVIDTWPVGSEQVVVHHFRTGGWTVGNESAASDTDVPMADVRWHDAILLLARLRAKEFNDDFDEAGRLWERYQARLEQARQAELRDNHDEPDVIRVREAY